MMGEFQKGIRKNWPWLSIAAGAAIVLFGAAYWWNDARHKAPEETASTETVKLKAPLPDTDLGRRIDNMLDKGDYQRDLPEAPKPQQRQKSSPMPVWLGKAILYTLVALGIFAIAVMIWILATGNTSPKARNTMRRKPSAKPQAQATGSHALAQPASLEEAEQAAKAGNFGEAVRMLLATALISLAKRELVRLRPWMTGREIVRESKLATKPADALHCLVATVEAYAFAGHAISQQTYETCFHHYQLLIGTGKGAV